MAGKENVEVIDSQIIAENVGFLDNCFENSFELQCSLISIKEYGAEELNQTLTSKINEVLTIKKTFGLSQCKSAFFDISSRSKKVFEESSNKNTISKHLKDWGLPDEIVRKYEERGIAEMFDWQVSCLGNAKVLRDCCNLVYSAPTSAGKTLVAEILTIKTLLERQKKVIIILPFVSIVREKMFYLQSILSSSGIRVEGFMGSKSPPGGLQSVHVAICTIEKANSLVNRLLDEGSIADLGAVIVDELHLLGDPHRGYILELLLTKIKFVSSKIDDVNIQIVGMSATLPNLKVLATWLDAELFITQFRPIPLEEHCLVGNKLYDKDGKVIDTLQNSGSPVDDGDNVLKICFNTIKDSCSVLIFCMTKNRCENLAQSIASSFYKMGCSGGEMGAVLRSQLRPESISEVLEQLKNCPVGLDQVVKKTVSFGVAYHHAGLTFDERDIIEGAFKSGALRVLVATSTLSSGVNLPARKVIIRTPVFQRQPINILTYKQMIGRAGRMGKDTKGESILICTEAEKKIGFGLMMGALEPVKSCIESEDKYMRAILEMIASQVACTKEELDFYSKCTLLFTQQNTSPSQNNLLTNTLKELKNYELVREQTDENETKFIATPLGKACLSSSMAPNDGLSLFCELQKARQCLVLETDLHLIYLVTPYSVSSHWGDIDWLHLLTLWESLTRAMKRVGELVGVQESFIIRCMRGLNKMSNVQNKLNIHKRFYTALALQDLVNEVPLSEVATKFQCARGFLQSLQQAAATFAGMVTAFCRQLGWKNMEMLISQFQDRLHFGIHSELIELMKLPSLNGMRARSLFDAGLETISAVASADINLIENALHKAMPFQSEKERDGDDSDDIRKRQKLKTIWITGYCGITTKEAAENLVLEARRYLELEIGVTDIKWDKKSDANNSTSQPVDSNVYDNEKVTNDLEISENKEDLKSRNASKSNAALTRTLVRDSEDILISPNVCESRNAYNSTSQPIDSNVYNNDKITNDPKITENKEDLKSRNASKSNATLIHTLVKDSEDLIISPNVCKSRIMDLKEIDRGTTNKVDEMNLGKNTTTSNDKVKKENNFHCINISNKSSKSEIDTTKKVVISNSSSSLIQESKSPLLLSSVADTKNNKNIPKNIQAKSQSSPSILSDDTVWDSMHFTEAAIENITKARTSDQFFSPNISFSDNEEKITVTNAFVDCVSKSRSVKDVSLFSSEGDNSSLFDESIPLDISLSRQLIENIEQPTSLAKQETVTEFFSMNSESILKAFKTTMIGDLVMEDNVEVKQEIPIEEYVEHNQNIQIEDEEDIKLVYEEETKNSENELETAFNLSQTIEDTQIAGESKTSVNSCFKSPFKRQAIDNSHSKPAKKARLMRKPSPKPISTLLKIDKLNLKLQCSESKKFTMKVLQQKFKCYLLKGVDVLQNMTRLENLREVSISIDAQRKTQLPLKVIGSNIINDNGYSITPTTTSMDSTIEKLTIYCGFAETCITFDLTSVGNQHKELIIKLSSWFKKKPILKTYLSKLDFIHFKKSFDLNIPENCEDISLAKWLTDSDEKIPSLLQLTKKYCNIDISTFPIKVDRSNKKYQLLNCTENACLRAWCIWEVAKNQKQSLLDQRQLMDIEVSISRILASCECRGVTVNKALASRLLVDVQKTMELLQNKASKMCGHQLNLHCSKDIAKALGMYRNHRKVSTKKSVLTSHNHPMSSVVIYWRKLRCILTNTLYPLTMKSQIYSEGDRINPYYIMFTSTGRISMHEPNLQSVPRTFSVPCSLLDTSGANDDFVEFNCRNIFIASPGCTLVSADYCQLEMRILTHYSQDEILTEIMRSDTDVFKSIAASWGDVTEDEVDDDLRQRAKQLCYGILYGMGNKALSQSLDVSESDAAVFMSTFYKTYPRIQVYTHEVIQECRKNGYVETLMKRRRYLPDINSSSVTKKNAAERKAVNTTIQGSAADIAKAAMCAVHDKTLSVSVPPQLILQMHDELIYEVPEGDRDSFARLLKSVMEETVRLNVPLPVKVRSGPTWGQLKEIKISD